MPKICHYLPKSLWEVYMIISEGIWRMFLSLLVVFASKIRWHVEVNVIDQSFQQVNSHDSSEARGSCDTVGWPAQIFTFRLHTVKHVDETRWKQVCSWNDRFPHHSFSLHPLLCRLQRRYYPQMLCISGKSWFLNSKVTKLGHWWEENLKSLLAVHSGMTTNIFKLCLAKSYKTNAVSYCCWFRTPAHTCIKPCK